MHKNKLLEVVKQLFTDPQGHVSSKGSDGDNVLLRNAILGAEQSENLDKLIFEALKTAVNYDGSDVEELIVLVVCRLNSLANLSDTIQLPCTDAAYKRILIQSYNKAVK